VLWTTDSTRPGFLNGVLRLVISALRGWQQALRDPELAIVAGLTLVEYQRCGWVDEWTGSIRCPRKPRGRSLGPCGRIHAYPTVDATTRTYRPTRGPVMQIGMGNRPHLDFVVGGIVMGQWLPYERKVSTGRQFEWMPADDYERFVEDRGGGDPTEAERNSGERRPVIELFRRTCEPDTGGRWRATIIDMARTPLSTSI
jgi:hypothetical protein